MAFENAQRFVAEMKEDVAFRAQVQGFADSTSMRAYLEDSGYSARSSPSPERGSAVRSPLPQPADHPVCRSHSRGYPHVYRCLPCRP